MSDPVSEFPSLALYHRMGVPYMVVSDWSGPQWTGDTMIVECSGYRDAGMFHELCHWLVASPAQREQPDFGLGQNVNATMRYFASSRLPYHWDGRSGGVGYGSGPTWGDEKVAIEEIRRQEGLACFALALYEPLVGVWTWARPDFDNLNGAYYDFGGAEPDAWLSEPETCTDLYKSIVSPLTRGRVTEEKFNAYLDAFAQWSTN